MNKTTAALGTAAVLALWPVAQAGGQELPEGTWTGTMSPPGAEAIPVTFEVGASNGAVSIVMRSAQVEGEMPFQDVRVDGDQLTFWWEPGVRVNCALERTEAGGFTGACTGESGPEGAGTITMVPPPEG